MKVLISSSWDLLTGQMGIAQSYIVTFSLLFVDTYFFQFHSLLEPV